MLGRSGFLTVRDGPIDKSEITYLTVTDHSEIKSADKSGISAITTDTKKLRIVKGTKNLGHVVEKGKVRRVTDEQGKTRLVRRVVVKKKKKI